jgi:hypothetical protein
MPHLTPSSDPFRVRDLHKFVALADTWPVELALVGPDQLIMYQPDEDPLGGWRSPDDVADGWPWTAVAEHLPAGEIAIFYQCDCDNDTNDACGTAVAIGSTGRQCRIELRSAIRGYAKAAGISH